jgi:hypothetical protein
VRLTSDDCWGYLQTADHGVLCTSKAKDPKNAIDAVPVCFAVVSKLIATPIDRVKTKRTADLGRVRNLDHDPSATLLCEHWDRHDWSQLWWVRASLLRRSGPDVSSSTIAACDAALRDKYVQYRDTDFATLLVFTVESLIGWSGAG